MEDELIVELKRGDEITLEVETGNAAEETDEREPEQAGLARFARRQLPAASSEMFGD